MNAGTHSSGTPVDVVVNGDWEAVWSNLKAIDAFWRGAVASAKAAKVDTLTLSIGSNTYPYKATKGLSGTFGTVFFFGDALALKFVWDDEPVELPQNVTCPIIMTSLKHSDDGTRSILIMEAGDPKWADTKGPRLLPEFNAWVDKTMACFFTSTPKVYMPDFKIANIVKIRGKPDWRVIDTDSVYDATRWGFQPVYTIQLLEVGYRAPAADAHKLVKDVYLCKQMINTWYGGELAKMEYAKEEVYPAKLAKPVAVPKPTRRSRPGPEIAKLLEAFEPYSQRPVLIFKQAYQLLESAAHVGVGVKPGGLEKWVEANYSGPRRSQRTRSLPARFRDLALE